MVRTAFRPPVSVGTRAWSGSDDGLHHSVLEIVADLTADLDVGGLRHQDPDNLFLGVDPEVRVVSATPPEAALRQKCVARRWVADDAHAQAIPFTGQAARKR